MSSSADEVVVFVTGFGTGPNDTVKAGPAELPPPNHDDEDVGTSGNWDKSNSVFSSDPVEGDVIIGGDMGTPDELPPPPSISRLNRSSRSSLVDWGGCVVDVDGPLRVV